MDLSAVGLSGIKAATAGLNATANNVANAQSVDYRAKRVDQTARAEGGVDATSVKESQEPTLPGGSNVDLATEATNLITQSRAYEASLRVVQAQDQLLGQTLDLRG